MAEESDEGLHRIYILLQSWQKEYTMEKARITDTLRRCELRNVCLRDYQHPLSKTGSVDTSVKEIPELLQAEELLTKSKNILKKLQMPAKGGDLATTEEPSHQTDSKKVIEKNVDNNSLRVMSTISQKDYVALRKSFQGGGEILNFQCQSSDSSLQKKKRVEGNSMKEADILYKELTPLLKQNEKLLQRTKVKLQSSPESMTKFLLHLEPNRKLSSWCDEILYEEIVDMKELYAVLYRLHYNKLLLQVCDIIKTDVLPLLFEMDKKGRRYQEMLEFYSIILI